jgi:hypothetical protein
VNTRVDVRISTTDILGKVFLPFSLAPDRRLGPFSLLCMGRGMGMHRRPCLPRVRRRNVGNAGHAATHFAVIIGVAFLGFNHAVFTGTRNN